MSITEFARRLDASKGSVREVLETLRYHGFLERDDASKLYRLGARLIRLGSLARARHELGAVAHPFLSRLAEETGEVALLLVVQGNHLVIYDKAEPERPGHPITISASPGSAIPLLAGACGKVILAYSEGVPPPSERDPVPSSAELARVLQQGFALDDEEYLPGIRGAAAPVLDENNRLAAVVLVSGLTASITADELTSVATAVARTARALSGALGWTGVTGAVLATDRIERGGCWRSTSET